jgi:hypothetical protein
VSLVAYLHKTTKTVTSTNTVGTGISRVSHMACSFEILGSNSGWTQTHSFFLHPSRRILGQSVTVNVKGSDYDNTCRITGFLGSSQHFRNWDWVLF